MCNEPGAEFVGCLFGEVSSSFALLAVCFGDFVAIGVVSTGVTCGAVGEWGSAEGHGLMG